MSEVRLVGAEDATEAGRVVAAGFSRDPVMSWVFGEPARAAKIGQFFGFLAREAFVPLGAAYQLPGSVALWTPPDPAPWPAERGERFSSVLATVCTPGDLERLRILDEVTRAQHPAGSHWFLSVLATEPGSQGHGLGSALLRHGLARVDRDGLPAYLESSNPRNVTLYERHGFAVTRRIELPDGPAMTAMWRDARAAPG